MKTGKATQLNPPDNGVEIAANIEAVDINAAAFDASVEQLQRTWHTYAAQVFCINTYVNGLTFSSHKILREADNKEESCLRNNPAEFHLRLKETRDYLLPEGKYFIYKKEPLGMLEKKLSMMHEQGLLSSSVCYFGLISDPFLSFHRKFDLTMACLELLEKYQPGLLIVQTRSPMVISALPLLKAYAHKAVVVIPVESRLESSIVRYTAGQPKVAERMLAAQGLRRQGVEVNLNVSPILPYGDEHRDAWAFAEMLVENADYVTFGCLANGGPDDEQKLRSLEISQKIVTDRRYRLLRPHAYRHVYNAVKAMSPEKLLLPMKLKHKPSQLNMFAA